MVRSPFDVAAWGLFEKRDVSSLSRVVSARTLDGYKIRAKLALSYPRPLLASEAEEIMMKYARAYASAVECELSNGNLPWDDRELLDRLAERVSDLPKNRIRVIGLHVWQKGAVSSGSIKAVEGNQTVPAMQAVQPRSNTPASVPGVTVRAPAPRSFTPAYPRGATPAQGTPGASVPPTLSSAPPNSVPTAPPIPPSTGSPTMRAPIPTVSGSMPAMPRVTVTEQSAVAPPSGTSASGTPAARPPMSPPVAGPSAQRYPAGAPTRPAMNIPNHSGVNVAAGAVAPPASAQQSVAVQAPPSSAQGPAPSAPNVTGAASADGAQRAQGAMPPASRMASGVVPTTSADARAPRSKSGFMLALEQCQDSKGTLVGAALAAPVRDAAAAVLFSALEAINPWLPDPLKLLDGRVDPETQRGLVGEACVCVSYLLYEALARTSIPQMLAIEVVQAACVEALMGRPMPVSEISRYLATESPREEFTGRACALLGVRETPDMQKKVEATLRALRQEVRLCADKVQQRLLKTG